MRTLAFTSVLKPGIFLFSFWHTGLYETMTQSFQRILYGMFYIFSPENVHSSIFSGITQTFSLLMNAKWREV